VFAKKGKRKGANRGGKTYGQRGKEGRMGRGREVFVIAYGGRGLARGEEGKRPEIREKGEKKEEEHSRGSNL